MSVLSVEKVGGVSLIAGSLLLTVYSVLFTLYRSKEYPKAGAVLIFAGALVYAIGPMISIYVAFAGIFTFSIGCLLIGLRLIKMSNI